jgi:hypothetical protein
MLVYRRLLSFNTQPVHARVGALPLQACFASDTSHRPNDPTSSSPNDATYNATGKQANNAGYQSMGSFHSDDIDMLRALPATEYQPPSLPKGLSPIPSPIHAPTITGHSYENESSSANDAARRLDEAIAHAATCSLGRELKEAHFLLDPEWTFVNHGR